MDNDKFMEIMSKLDTAIDELTYSLAGGKYISYREEFTKNAIRFIQEAKEAIQKL